jgi:hypothetical protein
MAVSRFWRALFAVAFLFATQSAIVHPISHVESQARAPAAGPTGVDEQHPFELRHAQQCDVCTAAVALQGLVSGSSHFSVESFAAVAPGRDPAAFIAAFTPLFRSQAPPALL